MGAHGQEGEKAIGPAVDWRKFPELLESVENRSVGTSPMNTVTGPPQPLQNSITMSITPSIPDILRPAHVAGNERGMALVFLQTAIVLLFRQQGVGRAK